MRLREGVWFSAFTGLSVCAFGYLAGFKPQQSRAEASLSSDTGTGQIGEMGDLINEQMAAFAKGCYYY